MKKTLLAALVCLSSALCFGADSESWYDLPHKVQQVSTNQYQLALYGYHTGTIRMDMVGDVLQVRWEATIDPNKDKSDRDQGLISVTAEVQRRIDGGSGEDGHYETNTTISAYARLDPLKHLQKLPISGVGRNPQEAQEDAGAFLANYATTVGGLPGFGQYNPPNTYPLIFVSQTPVVTKQYSYVTLTSASQTMPGEANVGNQFASYVNLSMDVPNIVPGAAYRVRVTFYGSDHKPGGGYQHFSTRSSNFDKILIPLPDASVPLDTNTATKGPGATARLNN